MERSVCWLRAKPKENVDVDVNCKDVNGDTSALVNRPSISSISYTTDIDYMAF